MTRSQSASITQPLRKEDAPPIQERARTTDPQPHKNHENMTLSSEIAFTAPLKLEPKEGPSPLAPASGHDKPENPAAAKGEKPKQQIRTRSHTNVARRVPERFREVKAEEKMNQKLPKGLLKQL